MISPARFKFSSVLGLPALVALIAAAPLCWAAAPGPQPVATAKGILDKSGVQGGLVVHLGCGDGSLTGALRAGDRFLVHGLDADPANVSKARERVKSLGLYGPVSIELHRAKRLPYADNLVNLIVVEQAGDVAEQELLRVLAPGGVACLRDGDGWKTKRKARPDAIDEWTHFLYDSTGNAVSNDRIVGPPRHMQWVAGPRSARGHENLGTVSIAVSSAGRMFYIADEGPIASVDLPSDWQLIARDAFSGVLLWKKPIPEWEWRLRPFRSGPPQLHRRLVAIGDVVYTTLGYGAPLSAFDAATGELVRTYSETEGTEEIVFHDGVVYLVVGDPKEQDAVNAAVRERKPLPPVKRRIMALRADDGKELWRTEDKAVPEIFPLTLAVHGGRAVYQTTEEVIALDAAKGKELWRASQPADLRRRAWASPTLVIHGDVVISADQTPRQEKDADAGPVAWEVSHAGGGKDGQMFAYSAETGERLWSGPCRQTYNAPPDVLITDGLLWSGKLIGAREPGITQALDPRTGEVERTRPSDHEFFNPGMGHHRCYRNKGTCRYLVLGRSGVEFVDLKSGDAEAHHWVRGTCQLGVVPCNGMVYVPPHTCGCFPKAKLNGFLALAPASVSSGMDVPGPRLERGPALGKVKATAPDASDWPTYRHDAARSAVATTEVPAKLDEAWQTDLGGRLSSVVVADGRAFVAQVDAHTVHALDAAAGKPVWSFVAGGRVDSPPTIHRGMAIFGAADGRVYCLRASDGELVWRFRAAPGERRVVVHDRLESAWPVAGAVLALDGEVYCAAGRSSYLDGGIRLCRLDAKTGNLLSEVTLSGYDEKTGEQIEDSQRARGTDIPGALPDVLSSDGELIFMRHLTFDRQGNEQPQKTPHLFSSVGFLDDSWWHRTYWIWGTNFGVGWGGWWQAGNRVPAGRLLAVDDATIYGFGRSFYPHGNSGQWRIGEHYHYFAGPKEFEVPRPKPAPKGKGRRGGAITGRTLVPHEWAERADLEARALVLAGEVLFAAGPLGATHQDLAAFRGAEGIRLRAMSAKDGSKLAECELDAMPVFDGMAAAAGRLYLTTKDGKLRCFAGQ